MHVSQEREEERENKAAVAEDVVDSFMNFDVIVDTTSEVLGDIGEVLGSIFE